MKRTGVVFGFFLAAILFGLFVRFAMLGGAPPVVTEKETFAMKEVGMPLDMASVSAPVTGVEGPSPLLQNPAPVSTRPYEVTDDEKLYKFADNKMSADCCPSPFTGDGGCICLTKEQQATFASRGGNRSS